MAWTAPRTWVAGELVTAAIGNTHWRDNFIELRAGGIAIALQAANDVIYASSATQLARSANLQFDGTNLKLAEDLIFTANKVIRRNTADASDSGVLQITGAGAIGQTRGSYLELSGNEHAGVGSAAIFIGNVAAAQFKVIESAGAFNALVIEGDDGQTTFRSSASAPAWSLNSTHVDGGILQIERSAVARVKFGSTKALFGGVHSADGVAIAAVSKLLLHDDLSAIPDLTNGNWGVECVGTSPTRVCALKVRDGGALRTIASVTY